VPYLCALRASVSKDGASSPGQTLPVHPPNRTRSSASFARSLTDRHCAYPCCAAWPSRRCASWFGWHVNAALPASGATVRDALYAVAGLGGHLKNNGPPGWQTLARGTQALLLLEAGWNAAIDSASARKAAVTSAGCGGAGGRRARGTRRPSSTGHGNGAGSAPAPAPRRPRGPVARGTSPDTPPRASRLRRRGS
jgi:hypothetical protein